MLECTPVIKKKLKWVIQSKRPECLFIIAQLINCACLEYNAETQMYKNRLIEIDFKERMDKSKGKQARINDR